MIRTLAHISDLHLGRSEADADSARHLVGALLAARVDDVVLTGDVTHRGRARELALFREIFAPLLEQGRLAVVPGNHDRLGDDVGDALMGGGRVSVHSRPGLHLVRLDSTAPHNRSLVDGHGEVTARDLEEVQAALGEAPPATLAAVMLHHHVLPLPVEDLAERLATMLGWPTAGELPLGEDLLGRVLGRCRLVLHGHRHVPSEFRAARADGPGLRILNAGSTTELRRARWFGHAGGEVLWEAWLAAEAVPAREWRSPVPSPGGPALAA